MICYLSRNYKGVASSGNKAKTDIEDVMAGLDFKNVGLRRSYHTHTVLAFLLNLFGVLKGLVCLRKGDIIVLQYPLKKYFSFIGNVAHLKGCRVVTVIHDLGSFRRRRLTVPQEIRRLEHADYIIASNSAMKRWLEEHGCRRPVGALGLFDYLSPSQPAAPKAPFAQPCRVVYAGALHRRKNSFLYGWGSKIHGFSINLYGNGFSLDEAEGREHFCLKGFVQSDTLIRTAEGDFGLVWDGDSTTTCCGDFGEYLRYNSPHKVSLYIRCGLPVIIWEQAALAPFIRDNGLGLCIGSLDELNDLFPSLSVGKYREMKENVARVSLQISQGHFFEQAVKEAVSTLKQ